MNSDLPMLTLLLFYIDDFHLKTNPFYFLLAYMLRIPIKTLVTIQLINFV